MGDLAFGKSFNLLKTGKPHPILEMVRDGIKAFGVLSPLPWVIRMFTSLPGAMDDMKVFVDWAAEQAQLRKKVASSAITHCKFLY
jgi:hypothetical protein